MLALRGKMGYAEQLYLILIILLNRELFYSITKQNNRSIVQRKTTGFVKSFTFSY